MAEDQRQQQIKWLEDERKKDRKELDNLREHLKGIHERVESLSARISDIPDQLARLSENASRINSFEESLSKQREDLSRQLRELNTNRSKRDSEKRLLDEKLINTVRTDLSTLETEVISIQSTIEGFQEHRQTEKATQNEINNMKQRMDALSKTIEEFHHSSMVVEEARKHDIRMIGDLSAVLDGVREKQEKYLVSQESLETRARRIEENIQKIFSEEGDRREELDFWMQQQQSRLLDFERTWKDWQKRFEEFDERAVKINERIETYQETYFSMKQVGQEMTLLMDKLERRITEIAEMQRLSQDKLKKELNVFLADDQKRWNTFKLTHDEQWRDHERLHDNLDLKVDETSTTSVETAELNKQIQSFNKRQILDLLALVRDWASDMDS